ncbi:Dabb family protein [Porifericola rhodea]|uniref:Dabb family protein n=1 Tax=Porifericola rhodea TaxID=930972 RepID=UPI002666ABD3|nr:Dabb family protein [Porifericola rhodea]WKN32492.1 Dabb family protein [Porifericola rhodea]
MENSSELLHHVFFWLNNPSSEEDLNRLIKGVKGLREIDPQKKVNVGVPAKTPKRDVIDDSYDVSLLISFNSVEEHDAYQDHPLHHKFIDECASLWKKVQVYDSQDV